METRDLFDLAGRTALVTGGGRGIGLDIALGLAEAGADVVVASRKLENCEAAAEQIRKIGRRATALAVDMSNGEDIDRFVAELDAQALPIDILVNNAGVTWGAPVLEYPMSGWDRVYNVNVRGLWQLSQQVARRMKEAGGGVIINVTSVGGYRGAPDYAQPAIAYNSSKGAVITLTKDMAVKLAPFGIRVNAIAPGPFLTDMMNHVKENEAALAVMTRAVPLARTGTRDDMKGVAVFLASPASAYVTGHVVASMAACWRADRGLRPAVPVGGRLGSRPDGQGGPRDRKPPGHGQCDRPGPGPRGCTRPGPRLRARPARADSRGHPGGGSAGGSRHRRHRLR
jgi:gluconate 5-dehydrogenase